MHIHIPYGVTPLFRESHFCDCEKMREIDDFLSVNITAKVICTIYILGCKSSVSSSSSVAHCRSKVYSHSIDYLV
jgi:hypothetical protein